MPGPQRFFFIRHGETEWNREGRLQGRRDTTLNALGRRQAAAAGVALARLLDGLALRPPSLFFAASPLSRTRDTMDLVRDGLGTGLAPTIFDHRLEEMSFGDWEGRTWDDLKRAAPAAVEARRRETWVFVPPGGESYAMLLDRVAPWLDDLPLNAIVVAHGGVARVLMHHVAAVGTARAPREEVHQGRVLLFEAGVARWM